MVAARKLKRWYVIHKWTSLVCTAFLLLICLTGLPLVFRDEIDQWLQPHHYASLPADTPLVDLDRIAAISRAMYPRETMASIFIDDDEPQIYAWMVPSFEAMKANADAMHYIRFDARTGDILEASKAITEQPKTFIDIMLALHTDLFVDLPGELFMGSMALLFVVAIISGVVLYGPFMKKLPFGAVRAEHGNRLKWLDLHNLLGIALMAWTLVVGITGVMNELSTPLFALWQQTDVKALLASSEGKAVTAQGTLPSIQHALQTARSAVPGMRVTSVVYPGNPYGSPYHFLLWSEGATTLTSRLMTPVLVDAHDGRLAGVVAMPWYLRALEVSRPLHFGDYGGMALKIVWAALDLATIAVLLSGLYLWLARRKTERMRIRRILVRHRAVQQATE